ncbi:Calx-beta domain-containing protein [Pedobacter sp. ok626]|nr:Calx-beta domain-containing protein [Pedobacter sp. ok626]
MSIVTAFLLQSCEKKGPGDNYDFSNSLPPYVEISAKTQLSVLEGTNATIAVRLKTAVQEPVVVNYAVSGAFSTTGSVTIPRGVLSANVTLPIPSTLVPPGSTAVNASFKITGAKKGSTDLTIGALGVNSNEVRPILIVKNLISFESEGLQITETVADQTIKIPIVIAGKLKSQTSLSYTVTPKAGNTANNLQLVSANPLVIAAGETTAFIEIKVKDNLAINAGNIYEVKLTGATAPVGSEVGVDADASLYTITVVDDLKTVAFVTTTPVDVKVAANKSFEVKLSSPSSATITVPYAITGGVAGTDYILRTSGTLTFAPGVTSSNINLDIPAGYGVGKVLKITLSSISAGDAEASLGTPKEVVLNLLAP